MLELTMSLRMYELHCETLLAFQLQTESFTALYFLRDHPHILCSVFTVNQEYTLLDF